MKERNKHLCTFALGALFVLASCDAPGTGGGSDSSVLPPIEESTSSSDGTPTIPVNKEILAKSLNEIVEAKSLSIEENFPVGR